ncbi:MAG: thermonuclease family protein [Betaproteobacteria bacterium]|nr:thermonuclease family protein [Betaproteobacteria bacterium]
MSKLPALLLATWLFTGPATAGDIYGRVIGVSDGDTISVLDDQRQVYKIRLAGIDAPEKAQPFGQRSKAGLSSTVFNREVEVVGNKRDRYGRIVAKVLVAASECAAADCPKSRDVGLLQVQAGLAWWYRAYAREQMPEDRVRYEAAESGARQQRMGLWQDKDPTPPWDWRRQPRRAARTITGE